MKPPNWFNDSSCGAVNAQTGLQQGLTCGLFAINHCLARQGSPCVDLQTFRSIAGDGCYPEGDFDDAGLQRNVEGLTCGLFAINHCLARQALPCVNLQTFRRIAGDGCYPQGDVDDAGLQRNLEAAGGLFESMQGADHEQMLREDDAGPGLQVFTQPRTAGFVIHTPDPRHCVAVVPPWDGLAADVAGALCDSLQRSGLGNARIIRLDGCTADDSGRGSARYVGAVAGCSELVGLHCILLTTRGSLIA